MPSTYSTNMGLELQATGENANSWGDITNTNLSILDRATHGVKSLTLSGTSSTLSFSNGALSDGQHKVLSLTGSLGSTHTLTIPTSRNAVYIVYNNAGATVTFTQDGTSASILNGKFGIIYASGSGATLVAIEIVTSQIQDSAITSGKLATDSVIGSKIAANAVGTSEVADDAITAAKVLIDVQAKTGTASATLNAGAVQTYIRHSGSGTLSIGAGQFAGQTVNITSVGTMTLSWSANSVGVSLGSSAKIASGIWDATAGYWFFSETVT